MSFKDYYSKGRIRKEKGKLSYLISVSKMEDDYFGAKKVTREQVLLIDLSKKIAYLNKGVTDYRLSNLMDYLEEKKYKIIR